MKKLLLFVFLFISVVANAQKGISYQAVILDPAKIEIPGQDISGQPFVNGNISVKFVILSGTISQFEEVQQTKTDAYGLVNLTIGSAASTAFNALTWDANQKSLQVFVSFNNGATYTKVSDQKLTYSPYSLFAETAGKLAGTLEIANGGTGATTAVGARANLGLGNVDNTADADKPISTATQTALNLKANVADVNAALALKASLASPTFTGTVLGISKSMVGLDAVDNTSDAAKPISTATQAALDLKSNAADVNAALALKASLASPTFTGTVTGITKTMVGLGNVDNTADASKPISTATQTALDLKANATDMNTALDLKAPLASPTFTGAVSGIDKTMVGLGFVDNTSDEAKPVSAATQSALSTKAPLSSPNLIGVPTAPTAAPGTNSTQIATTAYTTAAIAAATASSGVADSSITTAKIANSAVTDAKITSVAGSKITGVIPVESGGTGQTTVAGILSTLGFANNNIAIGSQAGTPNQGVNSNTIAIGGGAARTNQGQSSIAIGYVSGDTNQGANSVSIGGNAAQGGQGAQAVAIGFAAGQNGQGDNAVAIGTFAGQSSQAANSIAINATGTSTPLNPTTSGFFVDPIRSTSATSNLLYYNTLTKEITSGAAVSSGIPYTGATGSVDLGGYNLTVNGITVGSNGNLDFMSPPYTSTILGKNATISYNMSNAIAIGYNANAAVQATAIGSGATANVTQGMAIGFNTTSTGGYGMAVGPQARASSLYATAIGNLANSSANYALAIGTFSNASGANSTAIGYQATNSIDNTIQLGNTSVTNVKTSGTITAGTVTYPNAHNSSDGQVLTVNAVGMANWVSPTNLTVGTISNTSNVNGATIASGVLNLTPADASNGGIITTGSQTLAGSKTFSNTTTFLTDISVNGLNIGRGLGSIITNTSIGNMALPYNTSGSGNAALGYQALQNNTSGVANTALGYQALQANRTGANNVAIGHGALSQSDASSFNVGVGAGALTFNYSGSNNIGIGRGTMGANKYGSSNVAIGSEAGYNLNNYNYNIGTGGGNVFIGHQAARGPNLGSYNTAIGFQALNNNLPAGNPYTYSNNVALGYGAGTTSLSNNNTFLGAASNVDNSSWTNATAIGYNAQVTASNTIQLGNTSVTNVNTSGALTANVAVTSEVTSSFTIDANNAETYKGKIIICNPSAAITITFGSGLPNGFNCMVLQKSANANKVTFAGTGATIYNRSSYTATAGQYAMATILHIGGNVLVTAGDMQ